LITENKSFTLSTLLDEAICYEKPSELLVLNDQGGAVMDVSYEKTATLRAQDHGHPPVICIAFDVYNMADTGGGIKDIELNQK